MARRVTLFGLLLLAACAKSSGVSIECPSGSKAVDGVCKVSCSQASDCLSSELCDPAQQVCLPAAIDAAQPSDTGSPAPDASPALDAAGSPDASEPAPDATIPADSGEDDSGRRHDAGHHDGGRGDDAGFPPDAAPIDAGMDCTGLSEMQCVPPCNAVRCPTCNSGHTTFSGCYNPGEPTPVCQVVCPSNCTGRSEQECLNHAECRTDYCPSCTTTPNFVGCHDPSDPIGDCAIPVCAPCEVIADEGACRGRTDCYPIYQLDPACPACMPTGCSGCYTFSSCATGPAQCTPPTGTNCLIPPPACMVPYTVSYRTDCGDGCVLITDCHP